MWKCTSNTLRVVVVVVVGGWSPLQSCAWARVKFADFTEFFFCVTRMHVPISDFMTCAMHHFEKYCWKLLRGKQNQYYVIS